MRRPLPWAVAALLLGGCVGGGELTPRVSGRIVGQDGRPLGPGIVLIEKGQVHAGSYQLGALIDDEGRFAVDLTGGGTWGIHIFSDDYQYLPVEITIDDHQQVTLTSRNVAWGVWLDQTGLPTWPDQPDDTTLILMPFDEIKNDNPIMKSISMGYLPGNILEINAEVFDPNEDLARMILAFDPVTGGGYALRPPSPPNEQGRYPNGTYTIRIPLTEDHVPGESVWYFVVSDWMCNTTPILTMVMPPR